MQSKVRNRIKFIMDYKPLFEKWTELGRAGNLAKVCEYARSLGFINPHTGKAPSKMGVWSAMWRWVIRNPDEARPMYAKYVQEFGGYLDDDEWYSLLESRASQCLTKAGYKRYMKKYPHLIAYRERNHSPKEL